MRGEAPPWPRPASATRGATGPPASGRGAAAGRRELPSPSDTTGAVVPPSLVSLAGRQTVEIGVDTVHRGASTLMVQAACRVTLGELAVQLYRADFVPPAPARFRLREHLPADPYDRYFKRARLRPVLPLSTVLSPVRLLQDLFGIADVTAVPLAAGRGLLDLPGTGEGQSGWSRDPSTRRWRPPTIRLVVVGHLLAADLGRLFGRHFYDSITRPEVGQALEIRDSKLAGFRPRGHRAAFATAPVVEYAAGPDGSLFAVRLETRDINLPFARGSLDALTRTYLGARKADSAGREDEGDIHGASRKKTAAAYGRAAVAAVDTLLVFERMTALDRDVQRSLLAADREPAPMRPTAGGRVAASLLAMTAAVAAGSEELGGERRVRALMRASVEAFDESRYGRQTGSVHGPLNFSRSPTRFWHEAPGMIRDVDMSGCYNTIIAGLDVYWGRPVIHEPGSQSLTLPEAVDLVRRHAAPGGWYVRVTGDVADGHNLLIPSTLGATTAENYHLRRRRRPEEAPQGARLFSERIESGIVTEATWLIISALPPGLRRQYGCLRAESLVFYPRVLMAEDGPAFDRLVRQHRTTDLPWGSILEMGELRQRIVERFDADHVGLVFPIRDYARLIGDLRREARRTHGKDSGLELAFKIQANTTYGVLASASMTTGNPVAANQVTAAARAAAFALMLTLNGIQLVTDGCSYRRDQIPACTLAECLRIQPDYMLRRAEDGSRIPFLDPSAVPAEDDAFREWFATRALQFFAVGSEAHRAFFSTHRLAHKTPGGAEASDALACDGAANYAHCLRDGDGWTMAEMKMRGYGTESKAALADWIIPTYSSDTLHDLPPATSDTIPLGVEEAQRRARHALRAGMPAAFLPLGFPARKTRAFRAIMLSAFVCRTPVQWRALARQIERFKAKTASGLEALALRRSYGGRRGGSMRAIAEAIYGHIRAGSRDLTKALHLARSAPAMDAAMEDRRQSLEDLRDDARRDLAAMMDLRTRGNDDPAVGIVLTTSDIAED